MKYFYKDVAVNSRETPVDGPVTKLGMLFGYLALFVGVLLSFYGLVSLVAEIFGHTNDGFGADFALRCEIPGLMLIFLGTFLLKSHARTLLVWGFPLLLIVYFGSYYVSILWFNQLSSHI